MCVPTWITICFYKNTGECVKSVLQEANTFKTYDLTSVSFDNVNITIYFDECEEFEEYKEFKGDIEELVGRAYIWFYNFDDNIVNHKRFTAYGCDKYRRYDDIQSCQLFSLAYRVNDYS